MVANGKLSDSLTAAPFDMLRLTECRKRFLRNRISTLCTLLGFASHQCSRHARAQSRAFLKSWRNRQGSETIVLPLPQCLGLPFLLWTELERGGGPRPFFRPFGAGGGKASD